MKKNGFTLVELIAVIVILGLLITIAVPSVLSISEKIKNDMFCSKVDSIESSAKLYGDDKFNELLSINEHGITVDMLEGANNAKITEYINNKYLLRVTVLELVRNNKLDKDHDTAPYVVDPRNEEKGLDDTYVYIFKRNNRIYARYQMSAEDKAFCEGK